MNATNAPLPRKRAASSQVEKSADNAVPGENEEPKKGPPVEVFVISPIGEPGTDTYKKASYALKYIFKQALPEPDWHVHRADEGKVSDSIGQHVIRSIVEADLIVADLTGHNPNVFYELAVAHAYKKPVVHLISKGERLPFDVFDQRTIHYDITDLESVEIATAEVQEYALAALENAESVVNPLTNFDALASIRRGQTGDSGEALADVLEQVLGRMSDLENLIRMSRRPSSATSGVSPTLVVSSGLAKPWNFSGSFSSDRFAEPQRWSGSYLFKQPPKFSPPSGDDEDDTDGNSVAKV